MVKTFCNITEMLRARLHGCDVLDWLVFYVRLNLRTSPSNCSVSFSLFVFCPNLIGKKKYTQHRHRYLVSGEVDNVHAKENNEKVELLYCKD